MRLTESITFGPGPHASDHAALKLDYDARHPGASLPAYTGDPREHIAIHNLLHADFNALTDGGLPTAKIGPGHIDAHRALAAAYNARLA